MVTLSNIQRLLAAQEQNRRIIAAKLKAGKRVSSSRFGVLTGRVAQKDKAGKVIGITTTRSATRLQTDKQLRQEIANQAKIAARESDLERFLRNEKRLLTGKVSLSEIKRDIARRKAKGLSKTPAQRAALKFAVRGGDIAALTSRGRRKKGRGIRPSQILTGSEILAIKESEGARARSFSLGSSIFADPVFKFGGRTRKEQIQRGGTFGRRVGGKPISEQLDFVRGARIKSSRGRIGLAQSLLGNPFKGASTARLKAIGKTRTRQGLAKLTIPTFEQELRKGVGFFTTEAVPVTKPTKRRRLAAAKAVQARRTTEARGQISRQDDLETIFVLGSQVIEPTRRVTKVGIDPLERRRLGEETQRETEALRAIPFQQPPLTKARGVPTTTITFFPSLPTQPRPRPQPKPPTTRPRDDFENIFGEVSGFEEPTPKKKKKRAKRPSPRRSEFDLGFDFGDFELGGGIGLGEAVEESILFTPFR